MTPDAPPPSSSLIIRETWLTRRPRPESLFLAFASTTTLTLGTLVYWSNVKGLGDWLPASGEAVFGRGEYWRLWTTIFAHGDAGHLVSNAFLFFVLAYFLYGYFGARVFPFAALFWGGLANLAVLPTYDLEVKLIGASGVVYWMGGAWLALYFFIARQKARVPRWLRTMGVGLMLFAPQSFEPNISYRVHFAGFILGLLAGGWHFFRNQKLYRSAEVLVPDPLEEEPDPDDDLPPPEGLPPRV